MSKVMQNYPIGAKFFRGTVTGYEMITKEKSKRRNYIVLLCDCGNTYKALPANIKSGDCKSCGCLKLETKTNVKHGLKRHKLYSVWMNIRERCRREYIDAYSNYGKRGIDVCDEWYNDFKTFYDWAINNGYQKGLQIDRINNDGNYEPSNCRWVTRAENVRNTRKNVWIEYNGEKMVLMDWAIKLGINYHSLFTRLFQRKWSIEKAFTTPIKSRKRVCE